MEFLDTNVLLYAFDTSAGNKHQTAAELVRTRARTGKAAISTQVMLEFYVTATRKIALPMTPDEAHQRLEAFTTWFVHAPEPRDVIAAAELSQRYQLSLWDSMIVNSAIRLGCTCVWTEDLNNGQIIEGVRIRNPFTEDA